MGRRRQQHPLPHLHGHHPTHHTGAVDSHRIDLHRSGERNECHHLWHGRHQLVLMDSQWHRLPDLYPDTHPEPAFFEWPGLHLATFPEPPQHRHGVDRLHLRRGGGRSFCRRERVVGLFRGCGLLLQSDNHGVDQLEYQPEWGVLLPN